MNEENLRPETDGESAPVSESKQKKTLSPVLRSRLLICAAAAVAAAVVKMIGGSVYENIRDIYLQYEQDTIAVELDRSAGELIGAAENDFK